MRLQVLVNCKHYLHIRWGNLTAFVQNDGEFFHRQFAHKNFSETISKRSRQQFATAIVGSGWILCGKDHKLLVGLHSAASVWDVQFSIVIQQTVQRFQNLTGSQVQLIKDNPMTCPCSPHQNTLLKYQLPSVRITHILAHVLLQVCVLMIVDAHKLVPSQVCQKLYQRGLSSGGGPFQENGKSATT